VCCDDGKLTINGVPLDEPYIYTSDDGVQDPAADKDFDITVPSGRMWVMGDHRQASGDSLEHWEQTDDINVATIATDTVVGRAFVVFWPVGRAKWLSVPNGFDKVPAPAE
jgi:signal peptidase I